MSWSKIDFREDYNYLPLWVGLGLASVGAIIGVLTALVNLYLILDASSLLIWQFSFEGLVITFVLMYIGLFMDSTGFLLDSSWKNEFEGVE